MIKLTLLIKDKQNGTPGGVCEEIQRAIENIPRDSNYNESRFEVEAATAKRMP